LNKVTDIMLIGYVQFQNKSK